MILKACPFTFIALLCKNMKIKYTKSVQNKLFLSVVYLVVLGS